MKKLLILGSTALYLGLFPNYNKKTIESQSKDDYRRNLRIEIDPNNPFHLRKEFTNFQILPNNNLNLNQNRDFYYPKFYYKNKFFTHRISKNDIDSCKNVCTEEYQVCHFRKDAAEFLKSEIKDRFDSAIFIYCKDLNNFKTDLINNYCLNLIKAKSIKICLVSEGLAKKMNIEENKFYQYFKPSFLNEFYEYKLVNFELEQIYNNSCREILVPNKEEILNNIMEDSSIHVYTKRDINKLFQKCFLRENKVNFFFNKSIKDFIYSKKPIFYLYWPKNAQIRSVENQLSYIAAKYDCLFNFVFSENKKKTEKLFNLNEIEEDMILPIIMESPNSPTKNLHEYISKSKKYTDIVIPILAQQFLDKMITKYLNSEEVIYKQSKRKSQKTFVKKLNTESFYSEILNNNDLKHVLIQIYKHDCPGCFINSRLLNILTQKFQKYSIDLKVFSLNIHNTVPHLGKLSFTPMYFLIKKEGKDIIDIRVIDAPLKFEAFKKSIEEVTGISLEKIKLNTTQQIVKYTKTEDKDENFNFDFDFDFQEEKNDKIEALKTNSHLKSNLKIEIKVEGSQNISDSNIQINNPTNSNTNHNHKDNISKNQKKLNLQTDSSSNSKDKSDLDNKAQNHIKSEATKNNEIETPIQNKTDKSEFPNHAIEKDVKE